MKMKSFKSLMLAASLMIAPTMANAQTQTSESYTSYYFVQGQGGLHMPFTPGSRGDLMKPSFGLNVGTWFAPAIGARFGAEGFKSAIKYGESYESFNYLNFNLDAMINIFSFVGMSDSKAKLYVLGGIGLNWITKKGVSPASTKPDIARNLRVGVGFDYQIAKPLSLSLEYRMNNTADYFNGRQNNSTDWFSSLMVGVAYNFGHKVHVVEKPVAAAKALSLYDQMQAGVNERMKLWMKRVKGESKADYLARTTPEAIETQRLAYTKELSTELAGNRANTNVNNLMYNQDSNLLGVGFTDMPTIMLGVPAAELASIKSTKDVQFTNTVYNLNPGDKFEVLYTEMLNPATGKKYTYINTRDGKQVSTEGFMPLLAVQQVMENRVRLQQITDKAILEAKSKGILTDNTTINVNARLVPTKDGKADYLIDYDYNVKDGFSVKDDFAPGKYDADLSAASTAMLKIINESMNGDFAKYMVPGKEVTINYQGSADSKPVRRAIAYNGRYGDIKNQAVDVNGKAENMTITKASGIKSNEELSLVRATSVRSSVLKNVPALKDMKLDEKYAVKVSDKEGSEFRRVAVNFIFHDVAY
jgi:opacity protein-like surface antigen